MAWQHGSARPWTTIYPKGVCLFVGSDSANRNNTAQQQRLAAAEANLGLGSPVKDRRKEQQTNKAVYRKWEENLPENVKRAATKLGKRWKGNSWSDDCNDDEVRYSKSDNLYATYSGSRAAFRLHVRAKYLTMKAGEQLHGALKSKVHLIGASSDQHLNIESRLEMCS